MNSPRIAVIAGLVLMVAGLTGCWKDKDKQATNSKRYIVFVDTTGSITEEQKAHWKQTIKHLSGLLNSGDAITIYELNDRTGESAAKFEDELPIKPDNPNWNERSRFENKQDEIVDKTQTVLRELMEKPFGAPSTNVYSAIDRAVKKVDDKQIVLVFLSDMLHSSDSGKLNLEKQQVNEANRKEIITKIERQRHWHPNMLKNAKVYVVLPSINTGDLKPLNGRIELELFYKDLFSSIGGSLERFDTEFNAKGDL